jgi:hypothetical protein
VDGVLQTGEAARRVLARKAQGGPGIARQPEHGQHRRPARRLVHLHGGGDRPVERRQVQPAREAHRPGAPLARQGVQHGPPGAGGRRLEGALDLLGHGGPLEAARRRRDRRWARKCPHSAEYGRKAQCRRHIDRLSRACATRRAATLERLSGQGNHRAPGDRRGPA